MTGTPVIVVLIHGGPLDVQVLQEAEGVDAILTAWFPGQVVPSDIIFSPARFCCYNA